MIPLSYRSPKTEVRESKIHGHGLFATADIAKDEVVAVKGGHIISREQTARENHAPVRPGGNPDRRQLPHRTGNAKGTRVVDSNHSCDANLEMRGQITFVAIRNIHAGEELTHDWAMTDNDDYSVECKCGAPNCRKILTGKDWQRPDLQARYAGYFSAYLADKIARRRYA